MDEMLEPLPVKGYTTQSISTVDIVNGHKILEEKILRQIDALQVSGFCDPRWLAIARSDMEKAFMALNRAVFKPKRIDLG